MIVATAGHIDHGKTALVRALTGTDTDRLPEERARGITIDLGVAVLRLPSGTTVGFVDVPGHERLVRTMVAGASGVDLALLVVAADDGVMPQTREHVAVLDFLGVRRALVALTKSDRVDSARLAVVTAELAVALHGTALAGAPVLPCSSRTGDGIAAILAHLEAEAGATAQRGGAGRFRLAVDRSFVLPGIGLIATGAVRAGRVRVGDRVVVSPAGIEARVRGLQAHDQAVEHGGAGQRLALNLVGARIGRDSVGRGAWIVAPELHRPTSRVDVRLRLLAAETRALKHWTPVHLHLGTASVTARVGLQATVLPGGEALAQLVLDTPVAALWGDRFALRDASAQRTVGGGMVLDPFAPQRRGRRADAMAAMAAWALPQHAEAFAALLDAVPSGFDAAQFRLARNLDATEADALEATAVTAGSLSFSRHGWAALEQELLDALNRHHEMHPDSWGATAEELAAALPAAVRPVGIAAVRALLDQGVLRRTGRLLHLPGREVRLIPGDAALWDEMRALLTQAGLDPPRVSVLAERLGAEVDAVRPLLERLGRIGWLCRISPAYYILPGIAEQLEGEARRIAADSPERLLTVGRFREATGLSRHATMPILEFFDRTGLTRRVQEGRRICGERAAP